MGTDDLHDAVLDDGSFITWDTVPLAVPTDESYARDLAAARAATGHDESVLTGEGRVFGRRVAVLVCDFGFLIAEHPDAADEPVAFAARLAAASAVEIHALRGQRSNDRMAARLQRYRRI